MQCNNCNFENNLLKSNTNISNLNNLISSLDSFCPKDQIDEYPSEYPCVCACEEEGGGLMGEYKVVYVTYFPKNVTIEEAFFLLPTHLYRLLYEFHIT
jgi:hypothetical protein